MSISINNITRTVTISSVGKAGPRGATGDITPAAQAALDEISQLAIVVAENAQQTGEDREATAADRIAAAASAAAAAAATLIGYGVSIYHANGIEAGEYYAERHATVLSKQTAIYAEIINGDTGSEVTVTMLADGEIAHAPFVVAAGSPVFIAGLDIDISASTGISFAVLPTSATVREIYIKTYGAVT